MDRNINKSKPKPTINTTLAQYQSQDTQSWITSLKSATSKARMISHYSPSFGSPNNSRDNSLNQPVNNSTSNPPTLSKLSRDTGITQLASPKNPLRAEPSEQSISHLRNLKNEMKRHAGSKSPIHDLLSHSRSSDKLPSNYLKKDANTSHDHDRKDIHHLQNVNRYKKNIEDVTSQRNAIKKDADMLIKKNEELTFRLRHEQNERKRLEDNFAKNRKNDDYYEEIIKNLTKDKTPLHSKSFSQEEEYRKRVRELEQKQKNEKRSSAQYKPSNKLEIKTELQYSSLREPSKTRSPPPTKTSPHVTNKGYIQYREQITKSSPTKTAHSRGSSDSKASPNRYAAPAVKQRSTRSPSPLDTKNSTSSPLKTQTTDARQTTNTNASIVLHDPIKTLSDDYDSEILSLNVQINTLKKENQDLQQSKKDQDRKLKFLEQRVIDRNNELDNALNSINELKGFREKYNEIQEKNSQNSADAQKNFKSEIQSLQARIEQLIQERNTTLESFKEKEHQLGDEHRQVVESLEQKIRDLEGNLYHEKKNYDAVKEKEIEIEKLRKRTHDLETKLNDLEIAKKGIENQLNDEYSKYKLERSKLQDKVKEVQDEYEVFKRIHTSEKKKFEEGNQHLKDEIKRLQHFEIQAGLENEEIQSLKEQLSKVTDNFAEALKEHEGLKEQVEQTKKDKKKDEEENKSVLYDKQKEIEGLNYQNKKLEGKVEEFDKQLGEFKHKYEKQTRELESIRKEKSKTEDGKDKEITALREQAARLNNQISDITKAQESIINENQKFVQEMENLKKEKSKTVDNKDTEIHDLKAQITKLNDWLKQEQDKFKRAQANAESTQKELETIKKEKSKTDGGKNKEIIDLKDNLQQLREKLKDQQKEYQTLKAQHDKVLDEQSKLTSDRDNQSSEKDTEISNLKGQIQNYQNIIQELNKSTSEGSNIIGQLEKDNINLKGELKQAQEKAQQLEQDLEKEKKAQKDSHSSSQLKGQQMKSLQNEIDTLVEQNKKVDGEKKNLAEQLDQQTKKCKDLDAEVKNMKNIKLKELENKVKELQNEKNKADRQRNIETGDLESKNKQLVEELTQVRLQFDESNYENEQNKNRVAQLTSELNDVKEGNIKDMAKKLKDAEDAKSQIENLSHQKDSQIKALQNEKGTLEASASQLESLKTQLTAYAQQNKINASSSLEQILSTLISSKKQQQSSPQKSPKVDDLNKKIQQLEAENKKLKSQKGESPKKGGASNKEAQLQQEIEALQAKLKHQEESFAQELEIRDKKLSQAQNLQVDLDRIKTNPSDFEGYDLGSKDDEPRVDASGDFPQLPKSLPRSFTGEWGDLMYGGGSQKRGSPSAKSTKDSVNTDRVKESPAKSRDGSKKSTMKGWKSEKAVYIQKGPSKKNVEDEPSSPKSNTTIESKKSNMNRKEEQIKIKTLENLVKELNTKIFETEKRYKDDIKKKISTLREDFDNREDELLSQIEDLKEQNNKLTKQIEDKEWDQAYENFEQKIDKINQNVKEEEFKSAVAFQRSDTRKETAISQADGGEGKKKRRKKKKKTTIKPQQPAEATTPKELKKSTESDSDDDDYEEEDKKKNKFLEIVLQ